MRDRKITFRLSEAEKHYPRPIGEPMTRAHRHTITLNLSNAIFERLIERCNAAGIGPSRWASDVLTRELGGNPSQFAPETLQEPRRDAIGVGLDADAFLDSID